MKELGRKSLRVTFGTALVGGLMVIGFNTYDFLHSVGTVNNTENTLESQPIINAAEDQSEYAGALIVTDAALIVVSTLGVVATAPRKEDQQSVETTSS